MLYSLPFRRLRGGIFFCPAVVTAITIKTMDETVCQVCGERIEELDIVYCCSCATPHHQDCWDFTEHCSTYACAGTACTDDYETAQNKASEPKKVKAIVDRAEKGKKSIELVLHDQFRVNLLRPVVVNQVENGRLIIDNKEGVIRHQSYEKVGPSAFSRVVPMSRLSHTSVVNRHQGGSNLPDLTLFIPVVVTVDGHLVPITTPWSYEAGAKEAAISFGRLCEIPFGEMGKSIVAIRDEPGPGWLERFRGGSVTEAYGKQAAFVMLTFATVVAFIVLNIFLIVFSG